MLPSHPLPCLAMRALRVSSLALLLLPALATTQSAPSPLTLDRLTTGPALVGTTPASPQWSSDARTLAFTWNTPGKPGRTLYVVTRDDPTPRRLLRDSTITGVGTFFWRTRDSLLFVRGGQIWHASAHDGGVARVSDASGEWGELTLSPDGRTLSFLREGDLWVMPLQGGTPRRLTRESVPTIGVVGLGTYNRRDVEIGSATWGGDGHRTRGVPMGV
jgi:dipeptidyl-peptidase 4